MARIKMKDTTATADTGPLRAGEVYDVPDEISDRLISIGLASKSTAQTTADRQADLAADEEPQPSVDEQAAQAGTRPADQGQTVSRQPLNAPQPRATDRGR
jgi:hypothetical protein